MPTGFGDRPSPLALVLATADGHPRAASYTSWTVPRTLAKVEHQPFYYWLVAVRDGTPLTPTAIANARRDARTLHIGWVLVWQQRWMRKLRRPGSHYQPDYHYPALYRYLSQVGFHVAYQGDGVVVYRS